MVGTFSSFTKKQVVKLGSSKLLKGGESMTERGFTLIELIAVMAIIGIMMAVGATLVIGNIQKSAEMSVIKTVICQLDDKELESWTNLKLDGTWTSDEEVYQNLKLDDFTWKYRDQDSGRIVVREKIFSLTRIHSTTQTPGRWEVSHGGS